MPDINLGCRCGKLKGVLKDVSPGVGNRLICYCSSCQQFCTRLGADELLDAFGGTDIYQMPIGNVRFTNGIENLRCLQQTEKGAYRWYAGCCNTPIGNTGTVDLPFMGVIHGGMQIEDRDIALGPVRVDASPEDALKELPAERHRGFLPFFIVRFLSQMLYWKLTGRSKPNPVFDESGKPIVRPTYLWQGEQLD